MSRSWGKGRVHEWQVYTTRTPFTLQQHIIRSVRPIGGKLYVQVKHNFEVESIRSPLVIVFALHFMKHYLCTTLDSSSSGSGFFTRLGDRLRPGDFLRTVKARGTSEENSLSVASTSTAG